MIRVRTTFMLQIDSGICFILTLHWIPTQIQVFPQSFPSGNLCCNGRCFMDCSVPVPSSAAHLPDPTPFLGASVNYWGPCAFLSLLTDFFLSEAGEEAHTRSAGYLLLSSSPLNVCSGYLRSMGPFGWILQNVFSSLKHHYPSSPLSYCSIH